MLARKAYPSVSQQFLDDLIMDRFRDGHVDTDMKTHLCLAPATTLPQLVSACVRYETATGYATLHKPFDGVNAVQDDPLSMSRLTYAEVAANARRLGYSLRPWVTHTDQVPRDQRRPHDDDIPRRTPRDQRRPHDDDAPRVAPRDSRPSFTLRDKVFRRPTATTGRRDYSQYQCWNCGRRGHTRWVCKDQPSGLKFAPARLMNTLQEIDYQDHTGDRGDSAHGSATDLSVHQDDLN